MVALNQGWSKSTTEGGHGKTLNTKDQNKYHMASLLRIVRESKGAVVGGDHEQWGPSSSPL